VTKGDNPNSEKSALIIRISEKEERRKHNTYAFQTTLDILTGSMEKAIP
jgi:hypothetical protein